MTAQTDEDINNYRRRVWKIPYNNCHTAIIDALSDFQTFLI